MDVLAVCFSVVMFAAGGWMLLTSARRGDPAARAAPVAVPESHGVELAGVTVLDEQRRARDVDLRGRAHLIYQFATTCRFCEQQRAHMAEALSKLDSTAILTVSEEPTELTRGYWTAMDAGRGLPSPLSIRSGSLRDAGISGVPALIFVAPNGRIASAYLGLSLGWDADRLRKELANAAKATPQPASVGGVP